MSHDSDDVPDDFTTEARIHVGIPLRGDFDPHPDGSGGLEIDSDWYRVWLEAGRTYILEFPTNSPWAWVATFRTPGPRLEVLHEGTGENGGLSMVVSSQNTMDFFVELRHKYLPVETPYDVSVSNYDIPDNRNTLHMLEVNGFQTSFVDFESDRDFFAIDLNEGWTYQFDLESNGIDGELNPVLRLFDEDVNLVESDNDSGEGLNSQFTFEAGYTGRYYVSAAGAGDSTGGYRLENTLVNYIDDYAMGVETEGRIELQPNQPTVFTGLTEVEGDIDWLKVDLVAGRWYLFGAYPRYGNPTVFLRDTNNEATTPARSRSWRFHYQAKESGTHYLVIKDNAAEREYTAWGFDNFAPEIAPIWTGRSGIVFLRDLVDFADFPVESIQVYSESDFKVGDEVYSGNQTHLIGKDQIYLIQYESSDREYRVSHRAIGGGTASGWVQSMILPLPVPSEQLASGSLWTDDNTQSESNNTLTFRFAETVPSYFPGDRFTGFAAVSDAVAEAFRSIFVNLPVGIEFVEDPSEQADIQIFAADSDELSVGYAPGRWGMGDIVLDNEFYSGDANPLRGSEQYFEILKAVATSLGIKHFSTDLSREQSVVGLSNDANILSHSYPTQFWRRRYRVFA